MSQTLQERQVQNRQSDRSETTAERREDGLGWRKLLSRSALGSAFALAFVSVIVFKTVVPPLAVMFVLLAAGGALSLGSGKRGVVGVALASAGALMFAGLGTGFVLGIVGAPEEPREFIPLVAGYGLSVVVVVSAAVLAIRGRGRGFERSNAARTVGAATAAALVAITAWSAAARMNFESAPAAAGDLRIGADEFSFDPADATAQAGKVSVHVNNRGVGLHTFTIDSLGVDLPIPAGMSQRVAFEAAPGAYDFYCKLHPGMDGRLRVLR